jgi:RNA polymerase sigma factor (sigma-70 family)
MQASARNDAATAGKTLAALFDAHARMVLGLCRTLLRDPDDAEDAAQQAFLSAYRALLGGTTPLDQAAWLATIARNECRQRISRRLATPAAAPLLEDVAAPAAENPAEQAGRHAEVEVLATAVAELPERQREAVVLRDFYGLSYQEVATAMSVSPPAVESLLSRARRRLEDRVGRARVATGVLVVPASLQEQLAQLIPDFTPAATPIAAGSGFAALLTKLASTPVVTKAAAVAAIATFAGGADVAIRHRPDASTQSQRGALAAGSLLPAPILDRSAAMADVRRALEAPGREVARAMRGQHRAPTAPQGGGNSSRPRGTSRPMTTAAAAQPAADDVGSDEEEDQVQTVDGSAGSGGSGSGSSGTSRPGRSSSSGSSAGSSGSSDGTSGPSGSAHSSSGSSGSGSGSSSGSGSEGSSDAGSGSSDSGSDSSSGSGSGGSSDEGSGSSDSDPPSSSGSGSGTSSDD